MSNHIITNALKYLPALLLLPYLVTGQDDFSDELVSETNLVTITGQIINAKNGKPVAGANVISDSGDIGSAADQEGNFTLEGVVMGSYITVSAIGYEDLTLSADEKEIVFSLEQKVIEMSALEVLASRASEKTPVAYTDVNKDEIALRLGSQDIPLAMNLVPSVYSTNQGGGAGDARINVRGFNQRNVAIMINGIPVNDMENGWVYWSNWDGVADATSSIQMQKGLSSQNLATPSIGGSMNIITDAAALERGGSFKQEVGAWGFSKSTLSYNSGLIMDDKLALSGSLVRKTGEGYYTGTWTDAWAYYLGATFNLNDKHRFQFYALGAPQRHGQNLYRLNIAALDRSYAESLDDYNADVNEVPECGRDCSGTGSAVSDNVAALLGDQQFEMYTEYTGERHEKNLINERENFFHKPQVALNHYFNINEKANLTSSLYWSGGMGGGTGTYGSMEWNYNNYQRVVNYDATILENDSLGASSGILRNSNNRQSTIGLLSKLNYDVSSSLKTQVGFDYRSARIYHVKTIRDLLGGNYYMTSDSDFDGDNGQGGLGDPIDYNFTNYVNWLGLFGQAEYQMDALKIFAMAGMTSVKYTHWNHFLDGASTDSDGNLIYGSSYHDTKDASGLDFVEGLGDATGGHATDLYVEADPITTFQVKGGVLYELGNSLSFLNTIPIIGKVYDDVDVWLNFGLIDKAPVFDQVIQDWDGAMSTNPKNEQFVAFEFGLNASANDGSLSGKLNVYNTSWNDRISTRYVENEDGDEDIIYLTGINQVHSGIETEFAAQINDMIRLDIGTSIGNWRYTDDASGTYRDSDGEDQNYSYALKDLKVGDMPQLSFNVGVTTSPIEGSAVQFTYRWYDKFFADWSPTSREYSDGENPDNRQVWQTPSYGIFDLNASYDIPFEFKGAKATVVLNIRNLFDEVYVQDATDNSSYNAYPFRVNTHTANSAEVYLGMPTTYNLGLKVNF
jgi:iron complex outermembrane recepter protein